MSLKLTKVYTDVSVDFPLLTSESFVSFYTRTSENENNVPCTLDSSDTITIDSSTEVLRIELNEALNGKKCNLYLNNDKVRSFYNCCCEINLKVDEDVVFTETNQCTFTVEMDSLPLKKTYKIVKE